MKKIKKVGILTITDGANYGNRLQNYAMQMLLQSLNLEVETICRLTPRDLKGIKKFEYLLKEYIKKILKKSNTNFNTRIRVKKFQKFNNLYIKFSHVCLKNNEAPKKLKKEYDYFICGSDQIWNMNFQIVRCDILNYLASFADPDQRIAFAASFGTNHILPENKELFKRELCKFKAIAVREDAGKKIIDELIDNTKAEVVLDPTLLLEKGEWEKIESKPNYIGDEKFIVTYFLGGRSSKMENYLEFLSKKKNARLINLEIEFLNDKQIENKEFFLTSPNEFVWLIHHADCILTDSFHASSFAIIYEKPFLVFERISAEKDNDMGNRIDTLLSKFNLLDCRDDINNPTLFPKEHDYTDGYRILETERKKAIDFLKNALEV